MIQGFGQEITEIPAFGHDITEVRAMGQLAWQKSIPDYLCFTALEAGQFTLTIPAAVTADNLTYVEYSLDGRNWTRLTVDDTAQSITTPIIPVEGKVYWRGQGVRTTALSANAASCSRFSSDDGNGNDIEFNLSGCVFSLLTGDNLDTQDVSSYTFCHLFNSTYVVDASEMYFNDGTGFGRECREMFRNCTHLTKAPLLNHATLGSQNYYQMFVGCTNLTYVKCLATDISKTYCCDNWLLNVSSTGTFIQAEGVEWPRGASGIPTEWVIVEKRTMPTGYKQVEYVANPNKPSTIPVPIIETGIVLDPSQDTIEIAVFPTLDEDGYIAHYQYGGIPLGNNSSPGQSTAKVGRFYWLYRKNSTTNMIQLAWTRATATTGSLSVTNKIVETPQTLRIELLGGNGNRLLLNGTQVAYNTSDCDVSDMGTETAKLYGYNNPYYNWIDPIYYMKWWRNGVLIADYVACVRESDNEPSFYDFVSNEFKLPTRTGFFTAGEEI